MVRTYETWGSHWWRKFFDIVIFQLLIFGYFGSCEILNLWGELFLCTKVESNQICHFIVIRFKRGCMHIELLEEM